MSSGGSSLLSEMLGHSSIDDASLDCIRMSQDMLETSDVNTENVPSFLFQTGYLTVKDFYDGIYTLGFPNREVRTALYGMVLPNAVNRKEGDVHNCACLQCGAQDCTQYRHCFQYRKERYH